MTKCFDVVVVGGGIHGVGVAQAAAAAGHTVCLLEQYPRLAQGTSCRSSKLIHGGLRYLETGQFTLVRECLREREILLKNAPHLVKLRSFYIPIYSWSSKRPWLLRTGLAFYALLGGLSEHMRFRSLNHHQWLHLDALNTVGLQRVFQYFDAQSDDVALTHAVMRSATDLGAELMLSTTVRRIELTERQGVVGYEHAGTESECLAKVIVNATGPWANSLLSRVTPRQPLCNYDLVQGTHIVVPGKLQAGIYYVQAPQDGRAVFIMPWREHTMVGTTELSYIGAPESITPTNAETEYLLETLRCYFPYLNYSRGDVLYAFAGVRVLPAGDDNASIRPRETSLITDRRLQPRLISILGGKLTAYRLTAQKTMHKVVASLPSKKTLADTTELSLSEDI